MFSVSSLILFFMALAKKDASTTPIVKKKKPRKLSTAQLAARIARDSAELAKRATPAKKPAVKK